MKVKKDNKAENEKNKQSKSLIVKKEKPFKEKKGKWLKETSLTVLLILIIIAVCIGINIAVGEANLAEFDFSEDKLYSLSEQSEDVAKNVNQEIDIMIINPDLVNQMIGQNYNGLEDMANRYSRINDNIKVEVIDDLTSRPDLTNDYGLTADSVGIIMVCGENEKTLSIYDLYTTDYTTGQLMNTSEEAITNAIIDLTTEERPIIYNLTGYTKYSSDYLYLFSEDLKDEAYEFQNLDLLTAGSIPDDCAVLMITTLAEDITEVERDEILDYIDKGGDLIIFSDPNTTGEEKPNFQAVLDEYGVSLPEGVILEQDSDKMLYNMASAVVVTVSPYTSVTADTNMNLNACFITSGRIEFQDSEKLEDLGVEVETLANVGENAFYRTDYSIETGDKTESDEDAGYATVGALVEKKINDETTSELIVYSNNVFITNLQIVLNSQYYRYALDFYNNEDLAINSIAYLTDRDNMITIRKSVETSYYTVTERQNTIILSIIFAIPAVIIIIGIVVWQIRRRKK